VKAEASVSLGARNFLAGFVNIAEGLLIVVSFGWNI
jgi:hypothetical protein